MLDRSLQGLNPRADRHGLGWREPCGQRDHFLERNGKRSRRESVHGGNFDAEGAGNFGDEVEFALLWSQFGSAKGLARGIVGFDNERQAARVHFYLGKIAISERNHKRLRLTWAQTAFPNLPQLELGLACKSCPTPNRDNKECN